MKKNKTFAKQQLTVTCCHVCLLSNNNAYAAEEAWER